MGMITFLASLFIKDSKNYKEPSVRQAYGVLSGAVGIGLNILLFFGKWLAGTISGSIAIIADAFNNLSDAGSSIISLIGVRMAEKPADDRNRIRSIHLDMEEWNIFPVFWCPLQFLSWDLN